MQDHGDFLFHLEEPTEQFLAPKVRLRGWIAARESLSDLRLCGRSEQALQLEERPDVRRAFPNFPSAIGFVGEVRAEDVAEGALHFSFSIADETRRAAVRLAAAPARPHWLWRAWAELRRAWELRRLRNSHDPRTRWSAALSALLLEIEVARGSDFHRREAERLLDLFAEHFTDAHVVQIGANDGVSADPLTAAFAKTRWSGLLVEPVPYFCERLVEHYRDRPGIRIEQAAISSHDGEAPLYRLRTVPGQTPEWYGHIATLNRDVLLQHRASIPEIESLIVEERTPTLRLETLFARHKVKQIDLFVVDAEGHDFEILRQFDFARFKPVLVMFEHQHLSANEKAATYRLLRANDYTFKETKEGDAIAWRRL